MIDRKDVEHVARLTRLALTEAELERMREQLNSILAHLDTLRAVSTRRRRADLARGRRRQRHARRRGRAVPAPGRGARATRRTRSGELFRVPRIIEE